MGGIGSGRRWHPSAKETTHSYVSIDVRRWKRDGLLSPGQSFVGRWSQHGKVQAVIQVRMEPGRVVLTYRYKSGDGEWQHKSYPVRLDATPCHLGGERPWFLCPARGCGKRVAVLYGGEIFACRNCHQLAYPSQREDPSDRAARRADRIRDKLGWEAGILNGPGWKPKDMHWRTYERLCAEHDEFSDRALAGIIERFGLLSA